MRQEMAVISSLSLYLNFVQSHIKLLGSLLNETTTTS